MQIALKLPEIVMHEKDVGHTTRHYSIVNNSRDAAIYNYIVIIIIIVILLFLAVITVPEVA